jgi:precorrin-2 dehydrogenase/sirohydrochlorin ferrochelatase
MKLYPIFLNITNRKVVIIGGGEVALRKIRDLLKAGARISAISPVFHQEIIRLSKEQGDNLKLIKREYREGDLSDTSLAFSATDDPEINRMVFDEAEKRNIFINSADDPPHCSFIVPSSSQRGDLILALSTGGASPAMSARLRRELESYIPDNIERILDVLREAREILKSEKDFSSLSASQRGELLKRIANDDTLLEELVSASDNDMIAFLSKLIQSRS